MPLLGTSIPAFMLNDLNRKNELLQARKETVLKKERERKAKAQEKWKDIISPEALALRIAGTLDQYQDLAAMAEGGEEERRDEKMDPVKTDEHKAPPGTHDR